ELGRRPGPPQEFLLEWKDHGDPVGMAGELLRPAGMPCPHLGSDVVEAGDTELVRAASKPQVEARIIDRQDQIDLLTLEGTEDPPTQAKEEGESAEHLHEPHYRQVFEVSEELDPFGGHQRPAQPDQSDSRQLLAQRPRQGGTMQISRGLADGEEDDPAETVRCRVELGAHPPRLFIHQINRNTRMRRKSSRAIEGGFFEPLPPSSLRSRRTRISDIFLYTLDDLEGNFEGTPTIFTRYDEPALPPHCRHERLELRVQWLLAVPYQLDPLH